MCFVEYVMMPVKLKIIAEPAFIKTKFSKSFLKSEHLLQHSLKFVRGGTFGEGFPSWLSFLANIRFCFHVVLCIFVNN